MHKDFDQDRCRIPQHPPRHFGIVCARTLTKTGAELPRFHNLLLYFYIYHQRSRKLTYCTPSFLPAQSFAPSSGRNCCSPYYPFAVTISTLQSILRQSLFSALMGCVIPSDSQ